jgi:peptide/histidine transporter 3/4|uniref:Major facilitator superfamily (MFS) profile domain-containing protein n=2 Tax=Oryza TaxID=4527 RepID=A0A0D3G807_9ORYZ
MRTSCVVVNLTWIIGGSAAVEIAERFAFYGVSANLITYLTGSLGEGNAAAAAAINAWNGVSQLLPLLGGALADSWLGRYRTILLASLLYILGLAMLAFSTLISTGGNQCSSAAVAGGKTCPPSTLRVAFFYISLYMVAVAQGGHKPCVQAFGADQFDPSDPEESVSRSSFFNWWYFGMCGGTAVTLVFLSYVQDNIGWGLGFGIPCVVMACALAVFLLGTRTYRYYVSGSKKGVVARAGEALAAWRNRAKSIPLLPPASQECHPTATSAPEFSTGVEEDEQVVGKAGLVEQAKGIVRLFPIWATCLIYAVALAQSSTFFTKQAGTLDRRIGDHIQVPPAALQSFISITIVAIIPVYDRVIVPVARRYTGVPSGITMLQRIGAGMVLSLVSMVIAALVETRRLRAARDAGLVDKAGVPVPMSLWWMVPQYVLFGAADVFTMVGLQEFFYDQVPDKLRSLGLALYLSIFGVGSFISSALVSGIDRATAARGGSWFSNNLNRAHLDYFYWLIAALSALELLAYGYFAVTFKYKNKNKGALLATSTSC